MNIRNFHIALLTSIPVTFLLYFPLYGLLPSLYISYWTPEFFFLPFRIGPTFLTSVPAYLFNIATTLGAIILIALGGSISAQMTETESWFDNIKIGLICGCIIGMVVWLGLGCAAGIVVANAPLWRSEFNNITTNLMAANFLLYNMNRVIWGNYISFFVTILITSCIGALGPALFVKKDRYKFIGKSIVRMHPRVQFYAAITIIILAIIQLIIASEIYGSLGDKFGDFYLKNNRDVDVLRGDLQAVSIIVLSTSGWPTSILYVTISGMNWWLWQQILIIRGESFIKKRKDVIDYSIALIAGAACFVLVDLVLGGVSFSQPSHIVGIVIICSINIVEAYRVWKTPDTIIPVSDVKTSWWKDSLNYCLVVWFGLSVTAMLAILSTALSLVLGVIIYIETIFNFNKIPFSTMYVDTAASISSIYSVILSIELRIFLIPLALLIVRVISKWIYRLIFGGRIGDLEPPVLDVVKLWYLWIKSNAYTILFMVITCIIVIIVFVLIVSYKKISIFNEIPGVFNFSVLLVVIWVYFLMSLTFLQANIIRYINRSYRGNIAVICISGLVGGILGIFYCLMDNIGLNGFVNAVIYINLSIIIVSVFQVRIIQRSVYSPLIWVILQVSYINSMIIISSFIFVSRNWIISIIALFFMVLIYLFWTRFLIRYINK